VVLDTIISRMRLEILRKNENRSLDPPLLLRTQVSYEFLPEGNEIAQLIFMVNFRNFFQIN